MYQNTQPGSKYFKNHNPESGSMPYRGNFIFIFRGIERVREFIKKMQRHVLGRKFTHYIFHLKTYVWNFTKCSIESIDIKLKINNKLNTSLSC